MAGPVFGHGCLVAAGDAVPAHVVGFQMRRRCGDNVTKVMGEKDRKWVTDQVMDIEIPDALKTFKKVARSLL